MIIGFSGTALCLRFEGYCSVIGRPMPENPLGRATGGGLVGSVAAMQLMLGRDTSPFVGGWSLNTDDIAGDGMFAAISFIYIRYQYESMLNRWVLE